MVYPVSFAFVVPIPERGCCDFILLLNFLGRNELVHAGVVILFVLFATETMEN
jgi:hypothetical protein